MSVTTAMAFAGATVAKPLLPPRKHSGSGSDSCRVANFHSLKPNLTFRVPRKRIEFPIASSPSLRRTLPLVRVSSNDAQFNPVPDETQQPSFAEFITSDRVKVVAMLALALALCNADRVVMSVAIVPLSLANGWTRAFAGIVQVGLSLRRTPTVCRNDFASKFLVLMSCSTSSFFL